jgi:hypothetical protein
VTRLGKPQNPVPVQGHSHMDTAWTHGFSTALCRVRKGSQLVTVTVDRERKLNKREGMLEALYLDEEGLRVSRSDDGLLYVYVREMKDATGA